MSFKILHESSFLYFAYGYNMCEEIIHMNNPTAEFVTIGRLDVSTYHPMGQWNRSP